MWNPTAVPTAAAFGSAASQQSHLAPASASNLSITTAYSSMPIQAYAVVPSVPLQAPKRPSDLKNVNTLNMCRFNIGAGVGATIPATGNGVPPTGMPALPGAGLPPAQQQQQPGALPQIPPVAAPPSADHGDDESAFEAEFDRLMEQKRQAEEANLDPDERAALRELEAVKKQRRTADFSVAMPTPSYSGNTSVDLAEAEVARELDSIQTRSGAADDANSELAKQAAEWRTYMSYALQYNPPEAERLFAMYPHLRELLATSDEAFKQPPPAQQQQQGEQKMAANFNVTSYEAQKPQIPQAQATEGAPYLHQQQQPSQQHLPTLPTMAEAESRRKAQEAAEQALIELAAMQEQQQEQEKQKQLLEQQQQQQQMKMQKAASKKSSRFHDVSKPPPSLPPQHQQGQQFQQPPSSAMPPHQQQQQPKPPHPPRPWADTDERVGRNPHHQQQQQQPAPPFKKSRFDSPPPWNQSTQLPPQQQQKKSYFQQQHPAGSGHRQQQQQQRSGVVINFGQRPAEPASNLVPVRDASVRRAFAAPFNDEEAEEGEVAEEVPEQVRIRMRNIGKYTPTSEGPRSYGKTRDGFCDDRRRHQRYDERF